MRCVLRVLAEGCVGQENCEGYFSNDVGVSFYQIPANIYGKTKYDAASYFWKGKWRMPTQKEMEELCSKCTWTWIEYNGVVGYKVKGPNGNAIFYLLQGIAVNIMEIEKLLEKNYIIGVDNRLVRGVVSHII